MVGVQALTSGLNVLATNGQQIAQTFWLASGIIGVQLLGGLAKIPIVGKLIGLSIAEIGVGLKALAPAAAAFALQFLAVTLAIEVGKTIFEQFVPSDLGKQFQVFADQGEASLDRIAKAARIARGEVESVPKPKSTSKGLDLTLGLGNALGLGTLKSDDLLKGVNRAQRKLNRFTGADENFSTVTTVEEIQNQRDAEQLDRFRGTTRNLVGQGFDAKTIAGNLKKTQGIDLQLEQLKNQRSLITSTPNPDKSKLLALDKQEKVLSAEREKAANPVTALQAGITSQLTSARAALNNPDISEADKGKLQEDIKLLEKAEASVNKLTSAIKTSASAAKDLNNAFLASAVRLETIAEKNTEAFKRNQIGNTKARIKNFSSDSNASIVNPVVDATDTRDKAKADLESNRIELEKLAKAIDTPANAALLGTIKIGSTGKTVDQNSSIAELEDAKKGLKDSEGDKKNIVERLIEFKKNRIKLTDLEKEAQDTELALIKAAEAAKLAAIDKASAQRESRIKRGEANATVGLLQKKVGKNVSEEDLAIEEAGIAQSSAKARFGSTQQELKDVQESFSQKLISAEEYEKKRRGLEDSLGDLVIRNAQAELAVIEAKNRKILESYERTYKRIAGDINANLSDRSDEVKSQQAEGRGLVGEGAPAEVFKLEYAANQARLNAKLDEYAQLNELRQQGVISEKELEDRQVANATESRQLIAQLTEQYTAHRLKQIQNTADAEKVASDAVIRDLEKRKAAEEALTSRLELRKKSLETELNLSKAIAESRQSTLKIGVDRASEAGDLLKQSQGSDLGANTRAVLQNQLGELGFAGVSGDQGAIAIIQQRQALEAEAGQERIAALQEQQKLDKENLQLQLKLEEIGAKRALNESRIAALKQQQVASDAKAALDKAKLTGDQTEIANAQNGLDNAQKGLGFTQQGIELSEDLVKKLDERTGKEQQINDLKQKQNLTEAQADSEKGRRARDRELAAAKDQLAKTGSLRGNGSGSGTLAKNSFSLFGDDVSRYDRAKKDFDNALKNSFSKQGQKESVLNLLQSSSGKEKEFIALQAANNGFADVVKLVDRLSNLSTGTRSIEVSSAVNRAATSGNGDVVSKLDQVADRIEKLANRPNNLTFSTPTPVEDYAAYKNSEAGSTLRSF